MRDVTIEVSLYFTTGATTDSTSFVIYLNGSPIAPPKQSIGIAPNAVFKIAKLNPGDQLQIKVTTSVNRTADGSGDNNIYMSGTI